MQPRRHSLRALLFVASLIVLLFGAAAYIGMTAWTANHQPAPVARSVDARHSTEGTDATPLPQDTLTSYSVAADLPRVLRIEKLGVAGRILPMGVNKDNSMQAPININDSGWYNGSTKPGMPGAMVIDGHSSATNAPERLGLFSSLNTLESGDVVSVEKGDGIVLFYKVIYKETVALDKIDMNKVMLPYGDATEGLNLITCAGQWMKGSSTLDHRTIVYTERIST